MSALHFINVITLRLVAGELRQKRGGWWRAHNVFYDRQCQLLRILCYLVNCKPELEGLEMNVSIGKRWEEFIESAVENGRYGSASEVVREGLRLVEEREAKLADLRRTIEESIARGGGVNDEELGERLDKHVTAYGRGEVE
jgi:antitoxin ParD1/3/4